MLEDKQCSALSTKVYPIDAGCQSKKIHGSCVGSKWGSFYSLRGLSSISKKLMHLASYPINLIRNKQILSSSVYKLGEARNFEDSRWDQPDQCIYSAFKVNSQSANLYFLRSGEFLDCLGYTRHILSCWIWQTRTIGRIEVVKDWPEPKSVRNIQVFLGFVNFNQWFIQNFSRIAAPLTSILKTTGSPAKPAPSRNNGSKSASNRNDNSKPASERNNGDGKVKGFGVGRNDVEHAKKSGKLSKSGKLKVYFLGKRLWDIWYKTHDTRLLALFKPLRLEAL